MNSENNPVKLTEHNTFPLTSGQKGLWLLHQIDPLSSRYNVPVTFKLNTHISLEVISNLFNLFVEKHDLMRSRFQKDDSQVWRTIDVNLNCSVDQLSVSSLNHEDMLSLAKQKSEIPFDLDNGPLLKVTLFEDYEDHQVLMVNFHHTIFDGASLKLLMDELNAIYRSTSESEMISNNTVSYHDYVEWQLQWLETEEAKNSQQFWLEQLKGQLPTLAWPSQKKRQDGEVIKGDFNKFYIPNQVTKKMKDLAKQHKSSEYLVWLVVYFCFLSRFCSKKEIIIGNPYMGRPESRFDEVIGYFANVAPLRFHREDHESFIDILSRCKPQVYESLFHADYPVEELISQLKLDGDSAEGLLFQTTFIWTQTEQLTVSNNSMGLEVLPMTHQCGDLPLSLELLAFEDEIEGIIKYRSNNFDKSAIVYMVESFIQFITELADQPNFDLSSVSVLTNQQKHYLLHELNSSDGKYQAKYCVHQWFEQQLQDQFDEIAVVDGDEKYTYQQLNIKANQLAHQLKEYGVMPNQIIGVCLNRSFDMIVSVLAIWKAGGAYLPLDHNYPSTRLTHMIEDSGLSILISKKCMSDNLKLKNQRLILLDDKTVVEQLAVNSKNDPIECIAKPDDLAYIIYTSGSTGAPKGVMIEHRCLMNLCQWYQEAYDVTKDKCATHLAGISFDASVWEVWPYLLSNARIMIVSDDIRSDPQQLLITLSKNKVTHCFLPTALLEASVQFFNAQSELSLEYVLAGGEKLSKMVLNHGNLVNLYGPTEGTIITSYYTVKENEKSAPPIGKSISNVSALILSDDQELLPFGAVGELYIGGTGLARGYINQIELTNQAFIQHPFKSDERLYRSGDLVRYRSDGELMFMGRVDDQVKIRGFRIELGEIEHQILQVDGINTCSVIVIKVGGNQQQLTTYFTHASDFTESVLIEEIRAHLISVLPDYMVPSHFMALDKLPITANGKVDRKALSSLKVDLNQQTKYTKPSSEKEKLLSQIWSDVLNIPIENLSIHANFFTLGGDSILSIQLASRVNENGYKLTIKQILEHTTIARLAVEMKTANVEIAQHDVEGDMPLLPIQQSFFEDNIDVNHFNQAVLLKVPDDMTVSLLREMIEKIHARHDALRLRFYEREQGWQGVHKYLTASEFNDSVSELSISMDESDDLLKHFNDIQRSISISEGPIMRAVLINRDNGEKMLLWVVHHLVVDGVSWRILMDDMKRLYQQHNNQETLSLPEKTSSYQSWGHFLQQYSCHEVLMHEKLYWSKVLATPVDEFLGRSTAGSTQQDCGHYTFKIDEIISHHLLTDAHNAYRTQINELLLSALLLGFYRDSGLQSLRIDLEGHGREELSQDIILNQTVGWFTAVFPFVLHAEKMDVESIICSLKEAHRAIPQHGIGFGLLKYLSKEQIFQSDPGSSVLFNYLGYFSQQDKDEYFCMIDQDVGDSVSPKRPQNHPLVFNIIIVEGCLKFMIDYDKCYYDANQIKQLSENIDQSIKDIVSHCLDENNGHFTPSDFPLAEVKHDQLNHWQSSYDIKNIYPATIMQQGLLFHSDIDKKAYNTQLLFTLAKNTDLNVFQEAWQQVINRHDVLRTVFLNNDEGTLHQMVLKNMDISCDHHDISAQPLEEQQARIQELQVQDRQRGFDTANGPLIRLCVIDLGVTGYRVLLSNHHAILDGWSMPIIFSEVLEYYHSYMASKTVNVKPVVAYFNYIQWSLQQDRSKAIDYWQQQLAGVEGGTRLSRISLSSSVSQSNHYHTFNESFSQEQTQQLNRWCQDLGITLNTALQGAWSYLLSRYCDEKSIVFATTVSGRSAGIAQVEDMVGLLINTVIVKVDINDESSVLDWLNGIHRMRVESDEYDYLSLTEVQRYALNGANEKPIESLLIFENYPVDESLLVIDDDHHLKISDIESDEQTNYPITITAQQRNHLFHISLAANHMFFEESFIRRISQQLKHLLLNMCEYSQDEVSQLPLLSLAEEEQMLSDLNQTVVPFAQDHCVHHLFEQQVEKTPGNIALVYDNTHLTYLELNNKANQLAHALLENEVHPDDVVGLYIDRSLEMMIAILATWKAGAAYVPLDPEYPENRLKHMIDDAAVIIIITQTVHSSELYNMVDNSTTVLKLDEDELISQLLNYPMFNPQVPGLTSSHLAYVIYTSGSTGMPKGVMVEHMSSVNRIEWMQKHYQLSEHDVVLQKTPISFDVSLCELTWFFMVGARLVIAEPQGHKDPDYLCKLIQNQQVTQVRFVPSMFRLIIEHNEWQNCGSLKNIYLTGEAVDVSIALTHYGANKAALHNMYGPTEATVEVSHYLIPDDPNLKTVSIGRPIQNTGFLIMNDQFQLQPKGALGELFISGVCLARGYLNRKNLTAERFIEHTFDDGSTHRLYRTGDLAYQQENDEYVYVGRKDNQVKIRGFRIELGDIEKHLSQCDVLVNSVVLEGKSQHGHQFLLAYITHKTSCSEQEVIDQVREHLSKQLPEYMIPTHFIVLDDLPLLSNGKVDRNALSREPEITISSIDEYREPQGEYEITLSRIWSELLSVPVDEISADAHFFKTGGDSLIAVKLTSKIAAQYDFKMNLKVIFEFPQLSKLALHIEAVKSSLMATDDETEMEDFDLFEI